jgi:hypothetical protein
VPELNPPRFAEAEEIYDIPIDEFYVFEIEYDAVLTDLYLCLQFPHMFRVDPAAQADNPISSIPAIFDFEHLSPSVFGAEFTLEVRPELFKDIGRDVRAEPHS